MIILFTKRQNIFLLGCLLVIGQLLLFGSKYNPTYLGDYGQKLEDTGEVSILQSAWYSIYKVLNFISTGFGTLERSIFPEGGIKGYDEIRLMYLIPFILGIFMLLRLVPKVGWLARWAIAYIVGMTAGFAFLQFFKFRHFNPD